MKLSEQLARYGLTLEDVAKMGGPSIDVLKRVNTQGRALLPDEQQQINRIVTEYRLLTERTKVVVIDAISTYHAGK